MEARTATVGLDAPKETVFDYLGEVTNLPDWAEEYCSEVKTVDGEYVAVTPDGEMVTEYRTDEQTGVIDMYSGPTGDELWPFPTRVFELPDGTSVFQFTILQAPGMSVEELDAQYESLLREFENLKRRFNDE